MNGWMFFAGGIGMVAATVPVELALKVTDWRAVFLFLAALTLVASALIVRVVPEHAAPVARGAARRAAARPRGGVSQRARSGTSRSPRSPSRPPAWRSRGCGPVPWLRDVAGLSRDAAAAHLLVMALATMAGFLLWGNLAAWLARRGVSELQRACRRHGRFPGGAVAADRGLDAARPRCCGSRSGCSAPRAAWPTRFCLIAFRPPRPGA